MNAILITLFLVLTIGFQIFLFLYARRKKKQEKENSVLFKYNIKTRKDAWNKLQSHTLSETDRKEIEAYYKEY